MDRDYYFHGVTLLVTHYNRSNSLERLLNTFRQMNCRFDNIIISDDASTPEHLEKLRDLQLTHNYRLITAPVNSGMANNINKGQDEVDTPYTLYIQEDFVPSPGFAQPLLSAIKIMNDFPDIDYIRFWSFYRYPVLRPFCFGFSEIAYSPWNMSHLKFFMYSDNPHLRRSNFLKKFGRYQEGIKSDLTEYKMAISFIQKEGKGLFYDNYTALFSHENSPDEPSTQQRADWRLSNNPLLLILRWVYLRYKWLKCTKDVMFLQT